MNQLNRRQFIAFTAAGACAYCLGVADAQTPNEPFDAGTINDYPDDGVYDAFRKSHKALIIRNAGRIYAATAVCTHKSQTLRVKEGELGCPAHGSQFSIEGLPTKGPANRPLNRLGVSLNESGRIMVDPARTFDQEQWNDPQAVIKL